MLIWPYFERQLYFQAGNLPRTEECHRPLTPPSLPSFSHVTDAFAANAEKLSVAYENALDIRLSRQRFARRSHQLLSILALMDIEAEMQNTNI